jgi:hypothetical protein
MAGGMGQWMEQARSQVAGLDGRVRQTLAERAYAARQQQLAAISGDLRARMGAAQPDLGSVGAAVAERLGGMPEDYRKILASRARGAEAGREGLYQRAAAASAPGPAVRLQELLAREDGAGRATQLGVYGALGGGTTLGLTAAGQGLLALMGYLQQGQEAESERQAPLG